MTVDLKPRQRNCWCLIDAWWFCVLNVPEILKPSSDSCKLWRMSSACEIPVSLHDQNRQRSGFVDTCPHNHSDESFNYKDWPINAPLSWPTILTLFWCHNSTKRVSRLNPFVEWRFVQFYRKKVRSERLFGRDMIEILLPAATTHNSVPIALWNSK